MSDDDARHRAKMEKRKAVQDAEVAEKTIEKGLLIVNTGPGKGKTTAALGLMLRALGHGWRVGVVQFIKGARQTGERALIQRHFAHLCQFHTMGEGFTWETQDRQRDIDAAQQAWDAAKDMIRSGDFRLILCDELNIVLRYDYLDINEVVDFLKNEKPEDVHVVITGRNAKDELLEVADLVTDMTQVKHPFRSGVKPQEGIEF